ncbi:MAG: undecaprenyl-diphosphate phosphatase [Clostridia bacterium]|nr:undecaprenyl-diphosphate phosphatase [Clostridia bacterium]
MEFIEILKIILVGIIEGITEWLPVSSTGHMILFDSFFPLKQREAFVDMFEYVIQLAAILAVVVVFWKQLFPLGTEVQENGERKTVWKKDTLTLWLKVVLACVPALLALVADKLFEKLSPTQETVVVAAMLILYGIIFIVVESFNKGKDTKISEISALSYKTAFFIGCFQVLAAIPGTSRSGVTIIGALLLGVSRTAAAEFTFFLAIPTMVGASGYKLLQFFMDGNGFTGAEIGYLLIGCAVAFAVSLLCIKFLMRFVKKHDFKPFGIYRIILGVVVLTAVVIPYL